MALLLRGNGPSASFGTGALFPLTVSVDGRWVDRPSGSKFNMNGDTNWSLFAELTQAEATTYLSDRAAKGVNLVLCSMIEHKYTANSPASRNANGDLPFTGTVSGEEDFTTPNSAYWLHVDWIINKANEYGITLLALPCYVGFQHGDEGWSVEMLANGTSRMTTYGTFLGNRYASFPNLIWGMGGDWGPVFGGSNVTTHFNNLANAIKAADTVHLMTAHPSGHSSSFDDYNQSWLDLNAAYPGNETTVHIEVRSARQQATKPTFMLEARYGNEGSISALDLRVEMYQGIIGGGIGHIYGNAPQWYDGVNASHPANSFADTGGLNWEANLDSFGADKLIYASRLMSARNLSGMSPDYAHSKVTAGYDTGGAEGVTYCPVTASSQALVAYMRNGSNSPLTVAKAQFASATFNVNWYNTRAGTTTSGGTASFGSGTQVFTAPDTNDWVLLLNDQALGLTNP